MQLSTQRQLDIFAQIVANGDLHGCARELGLSVEVVEAELETLEDRLGHRLFTRSFDQLSLTPVGRQAISALTLLSTHPDGQWTPETTPPPSSTEEEEEAGEDALALADELTLHDSAPDAPVRNIILAAHPVIFSHFQESLTAFESSSTDSGITLRLESLSDAQVPELFEHGLADIIYFYSLREPSGFASRYAWSERISLFIAADHPLAASDAVLADDLSEVPYLALADDNLLRHLTEKALARTGLYCPEPVAESDNLYQLMTMVQQGQGYFAAIGSMARDFDKMRNIHRIPYAQGLPQIEVRQAIRPELANDEAVMALAEYLFR